MIGVGHEIGGLCYSNFAPIFPPPLHRQISVPYLLSSGIVNLVAHFCPL